MRGAGPPAHHTRRAARRQGVLQRGHRALLRTRSIIAVIPEPADQIAHRKRKGTRGGRPVSFDAEDYKNRNVVERFFNRMKNWRGLASGYDKHALSYRGRAVLAAILH